MEMILPLGAKVAQERRGEKILAPGIIEAPLPSFPPGIKGDVEARICVELVVTVEGNVGAVAQVDDFPSCQPLGSALSRTFFPPVADAVSGWQFFSGGRCRYVHDEGECRRAGAAIERMPMKLAYSFHFSRSDGVAAVSQDRD